MPDVRGAAVCAVARPGYEGGVSSTSETRTFTLANVLTGLRIVLVPVIVVLLLTRAYTADVWALVLFVVASVTDTADGYFARRQSGESRWGKLADPIADKVLVLGTLATLAWRDDIGWWIVVVVAIRELGITVQRQYLLRENVVMSASQWGKYKAIAQMVAISLVIAPFIPDIVGLVAIWIAVALTVVTGVDYAIRGARRARAQH